MAACATSLIRLLQALKAESIPGLCKRVKAVKLGPMDHDPAIFVLE